MTMLQYHLMQVMGLSLTLNFYLFVLASPIQDLTRVNCCDMISIPLLPRNGTVVNVIQMCRWWSWSWAAT